MAETKKTTKTKEEEDIKNEEEEESMFASVGIMFEGSRATTLKHFEWKLKDDKTTTQNNDDNNNTNNNNQEEENNNNMIIHVALNVVDDDPGALQSGHYLWPASTALCDFLVKQQQTMKQQQQPRTIVELGAGCALVSLVALQLYTESLQCIIVTDHDPTTLQRARENHESTLEELYDVAENNKNQQRLDYIINELNSIPMEYEFLKWGTTSNTIQQLKLTLNDHYNTTTTKEDNNNNNSPYFDLVLGSDLIYCIDVVEPLLHTAYLCMQCSSSSNNIQTNNNNNASSSSSSTTTSTGSKFLLSQSFAYDDETEIEIDNVSKKLNLERIIHIDTLSSDKENGTKIQEFRPRC